ncbi:transmembrane protein 47-like [Asterias amurensis]|uniref:transmembrane protein 47-like n=1 Tax=Asterias amurensis TaxID=7602 RepID=UPI003AB1BCC9
MNSDETTVTSTTRVVRPFKVIAIVLIAICIVVMILVLGNSTWITATGFYQGLWQECYNGSRVLASTAAPAVVAATQSPSKIVCHPSPSSAWIAACQAMVILALLLTIVSFVLAVVALCKGKLYANFYKLGGILLFLAAVFMLVSLAVFPAMSIKEPVVIGRENWLLAWGYGLGWGAFLLQVAAGILLLFAPDRQEIYYSEKTYYQ